MHRSFLAAVVVALALAVAGCGGSSNGSAQKAAAAQNETALSANTPVVTLPVIEDEAGLTREHRTCELSACPTRWIGPEGCRVLVILDTPAEVATYSGDNWTVTDPTHRIGFKLNDPSAACVRTMERALLGVELPAAGE